MKKIKITKISVKILLILAAIVIGFLLISGIAERIFNSVSYNFEDEEGDGAPFFLLYLVPVIGAMVVVAFTYILNKTIISKIHKLNGAATEVAKGNYDARVEVKGYDELSNLAQTFNKMTSELKANEYLSKEFVRSVSHEFKTPISAVKAYAELIDVESDKAAPDKTSLKEYSRIIMEESDRLALLSKSILQLSLLDSTTIIKKEDTFCPAEQIRGILRLTQKKWTEKNIELDLKLEDFTVLSNELLLHQVWQNLISNAIKFSNVNGKITITLSKNEKGLFFVIADNGAGIKEEDKAQIFNQFFVADKSRNTEGSGLGLSIVKKILEKLNGEIRFESSEGSGSEFFVELKTTERDLSQ